MGIAPYDRHRKVMLRRVTIKAHSVGVDDYIDPRSDEILSWLPCKGAVSKAEEGFLESLLKFIELFNL